MDNWKLYTKAFDDNNINYGKEIKELKAKSSFTNTNRTQFDLGSTSATIKADTFMNSTLRKDRISVDLKIQVNESNPAKSRLYDITDIRKKYSDVKDFP